MFAAIFILGIILGVALSILILVLVKRNEVKIVRKLVQYSDWTSTETAYIAGLSDEESAFKESLPDDKQVEIL